MENIIKLNIENGYYIFKLKDILYKKRSVSTNL